MSGGSLGYIYDKVNDVAETLQYDYKLYEEFVEHLYLVAEALHDIEWVLSGDINPGDELESIRKVLCLNCERKIK